MNRIAFPVAVFIFFLCPFFILAAWLPFSQTFGPVMTHLDTEEPVVVLTFDDGPQPITDEFLDVLAEYDVKAVFFVTGEHAQEYPEITARIVREGHQLALHSMDHRLLLAGNHYEIVEAKMLIEDVVKSQLPWADFTLMYFRPPYGFRTPATLATARQQNLTTVLWSSFPYDYKEDDLTITKRVLKKLEPGAIITLHDGVPNAPQTLSALPGIITEVRSRGYEFVLLNESLTGLDMKESAGDEI